MDPRPTCKPLVPLLPTMGAVTVVIPDGTYSWTGNLSITHSLALAGASATGVTIKNNNGNGNLIDAASSLNGHINIYWLNFIDVASNGGGAGWTVAASRTEPSLYTVLIHDCTFNMSQIFTYAVQCAANGIIFWNDTFIGQGYNGAGGITFVCDKYGYTSSWNTPDTIGNLDSSGLNNTYVEDFNFEQRN